MLFLSELSTHLFLPRNLLPPDIAVAIMAEGPNFPLQLRSPREVRALVLVVVQTTELLR
jgi:hypothetical protein